MPKDVVYFDFELGQKLSDKLPKSRKTGFFKRDPDLIALPNLKIVFVIDERVEHNIAVEYTYDFVTRNVHALCYLDDDRYKVFECNYRAGPLDRDGAFDLEITDKHFRGEHEKNWFHSSNAKGESNGVALYDNYIILNNYICYYGLDNAFDVTEKVAKQGKRKNGKQKKGRNQVRLYKCYTLKKDWEQQPRLRKPVKFSCPAWTSRGHMRHCKSGKVIYVRPCIKGKEKDKFVGKEYLLMKRGKQGDVQVEDNSIRQQV